MTEKELKSIVEKVITEITSRNGAAKPSGQALNIDSGEAFDVTSVDIKKQLLVPNPVDKEGYMQLKQATPARVGIWRAGSRYKTETMLRFRADHAAAQDAVFTDVSDEFLKSNNLMTFQTQCSNKDEYITRPDLGKLFSEETLKEMKNRFGKKPQVQIYIVDGLSSAAIEANAMDVLAALLQGLALHKISVGEPFFVKYGRVRSIDYVSEMTDAEVTVALVGERPGLLTAESMSAYMVYRGTVGMPEARMSVLSNIHKGGTSAVEAGAYIADLVKTMLEKKQSGVDLKI